MIITISKNPVLVDRLYESFGASDVRQSYSALARYATPTSSEALLSGPVLRWKKDIVLLGVGCPDKDDETGEETYHQVQLLKIV